jgi:dTDP-4-dehydrorhamnose reductase
MPWHLRGKNSASQTNRGLTDAMQRKLLVFGANGQVGREIASRARGLAVGFDRASVDICVEAAVRQAVRDHPPAAIVNAAAYTAVDRAETEPDAALRINRDGAAVLAETASSAGVPFIHLSTDYVFDGTKRTPYREFDPIAPLGAYGLSKAEGESAVRSWCPRHIILRTGWVYSAHGTNFVSTMLRLANERAELRIVDDQTGCPTAAADLADAILAITASAEKTNFSAWGTYHYRGADVLTWYGFACRIFQTAAEYGHKVPRLVPITTLDYPTPARRPAYTVLAMEKIEVTFGIRPRPLGDSLSECLGELLRDSGKSTA